jgi:hypothetical protein
MQVMFLTLQLSFLKQTYSVYSPIENMYSVDSFKSFKMRKKILQKSGKHLGKKSAKHFAQEIYKGQLRHTMGKKCTCTESFP